MKRILLLILAFSFLLGCAQETSADMPAQAPANESEQPAINESAAPKPAENVTTAPPAAAEAGEVILEVEFTEVALDASTVEVRTPNPDCYPDAQKCAMMDEPMHIIEEVEHRYYNLSSGSDICLLAPGGPEEALYLVRYTVENQDSTAHTISPELLVKTGNPKMMGYLVSTPYSKANCTGFYDGSDLDIELGPSESMDFKALIVLPESETPLQASVFVDAQ
jgi:hypothetical protein